MRHSGTAAQLRLCLLFPLRPVCLAMALTAERARDFVRDGYVRLPRAVDPSLVSAARRAINATLGHEGIDKAQIVTFHSRS